MSDLGFGNIDLSLNMDQLNADLLAYGQTPEGQAAFAQYNLPADSGAQPVSREQPIVSETETERIARLDRESNAAIAANDLAFAQQQSDMRTNQQRQDARRYMATILDSYGLGDLTDFTYTNIIAEGITDPAVIEFKLRDQPAYQKRFAGNAARVKKGLPELDAASYIALESQYRETLRSNLGPEMASIYATQDEFKSLIEGDVSNAELQSRIEQGYRAVADADPAVKEQMRLLYGVGDNQLVGYFLDPTKAAPLLTRRAQAANIAARGLEQGGIQLSGAFAEDLASRGFTEQQARAGFVEVGALNELKQTFAGETALSGEQLAGAAFGIDVAAQQELERRKKLRTGEFAGGGSFARTTGETSGSISTSVGKAQ